MTSTADGADGLPGAFAAAEVAFGCWLLSGVARRLSLSTCGALFAAFAAYHALQIHRGRGAPCGCFGGANLSHELLAVVCLSGSLACLLAVKRRIAETLPRLSVTVQASFGLLAAWV